MLKMQIRFPSGLEEQGLEAARGPSRLGGEKTVSRFMKDPHPEVEAKTISLHVRQSSFISLQRKLPCL